MSSPELLAGPTAGAQVGGTPQVTAEVAVPHALTGEVRDSSGAIIAGAAVHLQGTSLSRDTETDHTGHFSLDLPPGVYRLLIEAPGFAPLIRDGLRVAGKPLAPLNLTLKIATETQTLDVGGEDVTSTDAADNRNALVFNKEKLSTLSDDDATLQQQLLGMAGGDGQHPPQILVDGFSGGRFPPKSSIREVRINQNPYSAQYDDLGFGRIEIFTKPGSDKLHGFLQVQGNDKSFNSLNPFTGGQQPPYHTLFVDGNVSGPLGKKTSFFGSANYRDQQNNAIVNAIVLGPAFTQAQFSQAVPNPQTSHSYSARLDRQMSTNNTFTSRYEYNQNLLTNGGVGLLTLPTQGFNNAATTQTLQLGNTEIIGPKMVNETRFQYIRTRLNQTPVSSATSITVQGAFNDGGNPAQALRDNQDRYEFQDYLSISHGKHFIRAGARYRLLRDANLSTADYNGQYTFPDISTYQITQQGIAARLSPAQIRAAGGGATQFTLTAGKASAAIVTGDIGVYAEDEWKVAKGVTLNLGLRFESQSAIPDHSDPAPRAGFAWAVHQQAKKGPWFTLRGGTGLFYNRFESTNILQSVRQNGITQQSYIVRNPDTYPNLPPTSSLTGVQPTIYRIDPKFRSQYDFVAGFSVERSLGKKGSASVTYNQIHSVHDTISLNVNAPLPGTYDPTVPGSGVRPLGGNGNLYQFSSNAFLNGTLLFANMNLSPAKWISLWGFYVYQDFHSTSIGASQFPSNTYDVAADYGRAPFNITSRAFVGGTITLPHGFSVEPFLIAHGSRVFNITTGSDNNGDSIYNDRPSFATDLTRPSVVRTALGNFDTAPIAGQTIVPSNYGNGPAFVSFQLSASKNFKFGPRPAAPADAPAPPPGTKGPAPRPDPRYELGFSAEAENLFNNVNGGLPIGVLTSPFFGKSISLDGSFFNSSAANRIINLRSYFRF